MEIPKDPRFKNLLGKKFSRLTVLSYAGAIAGRQKIWLCECECGTRKSIRSGSLLNGSVKSCGCLSSEVTANRNRTHGMRNHSLYPIWNNMRFRCLNPKCAEWKNYGARGIKICPEWDSFRVFAQDMGDKPTAAHSLERKDTNGDYSPSNCVWATNTEQSNNKRNNRRITIGPVTLTVAQWEKERGFTKDLLRSRLKAGWDPVDAVLRPVRGGIKLKSA